MMQIAQSIFQEFTTLIQRRLQSAQERVQTTEHERMNRYYKGQVDTLSLVLHDIDALKFEFGMELNPEAIPESPAQKAQEAQKAIQRQEETLPQDTKPEKPARGKGRAKKPKVEKVEETPVFIYQALAHQAVERGIITRKISHFYHDLLPEKHVKGYPALYRAFEEDENLRQEVRKALEMPISQEHVSVEVSAVDPHGAEGYSEETPISQERVSVEVPPTDPHNIEEQERNE